MCLLWPGYSEMLCGVMGRPPSSLSKDFVEPLIKSQWYVDCDELAQRELDAVLKHKALTLPQDAEFGHGAPGGGIRGADR